MWKYLVLVVTLLSFSTPAEAFHPVRSAGKATLRVAAKSMKVLKVRPVRALVKHRAARNVG